MSKRGLYKTDIETIMRNAFFKEGLNPISEYPIRCRYGYVLDFAFPDLKIGIECDGEAWHPEGNSHDRKRDGYLKSHGWIMLRFKGNDIMNNIQQCINQCKEVIENEQQRNTRRNL